MNDTAPSLERRTGLTVVMAGDLSLSITQVLAEVAQDGTPREIQEGLGSTRVLGRLVAADYDMSLLRALTAYEHDVVHELLQVSDWTGLTTFAELERAHTALVKGGVSFRSPAWETLPPGPHRVEDLLLYNVLGSRHGVMLDSPYPAADWGHAVEHFARMRYMPSEWDRKEAARIATLACLDGLSPREAVDKVEQAIREGVIWKCIEEIFGPEALPNDLLAIHTQDLRRRIRNVLPNGMARDDFFLLLRCGIPIHMVESYVLYAGVVDPQEITRLHEDGVHPMLVSRARAEGLPEEHWAQVLGPLGQCVKLTVYETWLCPIGAEPGLYTLPELVSDGEPLKCRVAWDTPKESLRGMPEHWRRELADGAVDPHLFEGIVGRLPRHFSNVVTVNAFNVRHEDIQTAIRVATAGMTSELLERLKTPAGYRLRLSADQLERFGRLAPTASEAVYLGVLDEQSVGAEFWLGRLKTWRAMTERTVDLFDRLRTGEDTAPLVAFLVATRPAKVFLGQHPMRTEALEVLALHPDAVDVGGVHAEALHFALSKQIRANGVPATLWDAMHQAVSLLGALLIDFELVG